MLQVKGVGLPAGQIPNNMFVDHAHTAELRQSTEQQWDLREREIALMQHPVYYQLPTGGVSQHVHRNIRYLCFVDTFDVWGGEVSVDLIDVLLVHVLRHTVLVEVVHHVGARQHAVHLKPNILLGLTVTTGPANMTFTEQR